MKKYILATLITLSVNIAFAQDFFDALRYSQTEYGGTARSIAMGSAFGALGGDFISASINPAGLGLYRSGEFSMSPTLNVNMVDANYLGTSQTNDKYNFNFNNLSYVATTKTGVETGIVNVTFGVGYNRLKNFNSNVTVQGYDANTTLLNYYADYANQFGDPNQFDYHHEGLAWNTWLVDEDPDPSVIEGIYYNNISEYNKYDIYDENNNYIGIGYEPSGVKPHQQRNLISRTGRLDEYLMSLGLNINHKVYLGASIGLLDLRLEERMVYSEIDNNNNINNFKDFSLDSYLLESGFGVNFKTGIIFRPTKSLRIGASVHTPNFFNISRYEDKEMVANYDNEIGSDATGTSAQWEDENSISYDYSFESPLKANLSVAYSLGNKAIVSADYEFINYGGAKFRDAGDGYDYTDNNVDIQNTLSATGNVRIGAEYRVTPNFSVRGGYNLIGNPWKSSFTYSDGTTEDIVNKNDTFNSYSAGFGYRQQNFYIDFAYRLNQSQTTFKVHDIYYSNPTGGNALATLNELNNQATITFGFRF